MAAKWRQLCQEQPLLSKIKEISFCDKNVSSIKSNTEISCDTSNGIKHLVEFEKKQTTKNISKTVQHDIAKRKHVIDAKDTMEDATKKKCQEDNFKICESDLCKGENRKSDVR